MKPSEQLQKVLIAVGADFWPAVKDKQVFQEHYIQWYAQ